MAIKYTWPCPHCGGAIEGRGPQSEKTKRKLSRLMRGRKFTPEHREALSQAQLKRHRRLKRNKGKTK